MRFGKTSIALAAAMLAARVLAAQGGDTTQPPSVKLHGTTKLAPPSDAENQDATGFASLLQWGERMAIHVFVRHLEPGAAYDVTATRKNTEGQDESASLGTITTRKGTPPPPHCYKAFLKPVVVEPPPASGGSAAGMGANGWPFGHGTHPQMAGGMAVLILDKNATGLHYDLHVWGTVTGAALVFGTGDPVPLTLDDKLDGSLTIDADQLALLVSGDVVLDVKATVKDESGQDQATDLSGKVKPCFPWLADFLERLAAHLSGTGALRLDTKRGDTMPFGVTDLRDLVGASLSVKDGAGKVVLAGVIGELLEFPSPKPTQNGNQTAAGGGSVVTSDEDQVLAVAGVDLFFDMAETHDASFIRSDANEDRQVDLADTVFVLQYLFLDGAAPDCLDAADANDSGRVDIADAIFMLLSQFQDTGSRLPPYPERGFDPTVDGLFCGASQ